MEEELGVSLRIIDLAVLAQALAFGVLAAGFTRTWLSSRLRSSAVAAIGLGFSALLDASTFLIGYLPQRPSGLEDAVSDLSTLDWLGSIAGTLLLQLPLLVGAVAAVLTLRSLGVLARSTEKPSA